MPELVRSGCIRRRGRSPRNACFTEKYSCRSSIFPRHVLSMEVESRQYNDVDSVFSPDQIRSGNETKYQISPRMERLSTPRINNLSYYSLCSPSISETRTKISQLPEGNVGSYESSYAGSLLHDIAIYKEKQMNNMLYADCNNHLFYYSKSELDTLSTCGHCGQSKLCESPPLFWSPLNNKNDSNECETRFGDKMPSSPMKKSGGGGSFTSALSRKTTPLSLSGFRKSQSHPSLLRLLCWRSEDEAVPTFSTRTLQHTEQGNINNRTLSASIPELNPRINVMFQYFWKKNELRVTLLEAFNLLQKTSKSVAVFAKICLMPGKKQTQYSKRHSAVCDHVFDEEFLFRSDLQHQGSTELKIKLYNKPGIFAMPEAIGSCIIPLYRYSFSSTAHVVCRELTK